MIRKLIFKILLATIMGLFICTNTIFADVIPEKPQVITSESASFPTINLVTTDGSTIYYTLDGSTPTTDSQVYTTGIAIPKIIFTHVFMLKSIAVLNGVSSEVFTSEISIAPLIPTSSGGGGGVTPSPVPVVLSPTISDMGFTSLDGTEITDIGVNVKLRGYADIDNRCGIVKDNIASFFVACYVDNKLYYTRTFTASIDANTYAFDEKVICILGQK